MCPVPIAIDKPKGFDEVIELIDEQDWTIQESLYLAVIILDVVFSTMDTETRTDLLGLFVDRYKQKGN